MNVFVAFGSPRKNGNTSKLVEIFCDELKKGGCNIDLCYLDDYKINPCKECLCCKNQKNNIGYCAIKDEMQDIYKRVITADLIVIASPVFMWTYSAQTKLFLDRMFALTSTDLFCKNNTKIALLGTSGGDAFDGADLMVASFRHFASIGNMKNVGHLIVSSIDNTLPDSIKESARSFACKILMKCK